MKQHALLDTIRSIKGFKNDAELCRAFELDTPLVSNIRSGRRPVGPTMIIRFHEETGLSIKVIKALLTS